MRYVKYVGLSHMRVLTAQDWRRAGMNGETRVWNAYNGFALPLDQFTDEQIRKAIEPDPYFVITGEGDDQNEPFEPKPQNRDMTPAELQQATENPVDVLALADGAPMPSRTDSQPSAGAAPNGGESDDRRQEVLEDTPAEENATADKSTAKRSR